MAAPVTAALQPAASYQMHMLTKHIKELASCTWSAMLWFSTTCCSLEAFQLHRRNDPRTQSGTKNSCRNRNCAAHAGRNGLIGFADTMEEPSRQKAVSKTPS